jgi:hypothetical protein
LGEPYYTEAMLPKGYMAIIDWFQEVAADDDYANPKFHRYDNDETDTEMEPQEEGVELNLVTRPAEERIEVLN